MYIVALGNIGSMEMYSLKKIGGEIDWLENLEIPEYIMETLDESCLVFGEISEELEHKLRKAKVPFLRSVFAIERKVLRKWDSANAEQKETFETAEKTSLYIPNGEYWRGYCLGKVEALHESLEELR